MFIIRESLENRWTISWSWHGLCDVVSIDTGRPLRSDVAMTGEISLRGRVLAIGGVKEKLLAAHARGMKLCFLPLENRSNLDDLPKFVLKSMEIRCVSSIDEVLPFVFEQEKRSSAIKNDRFALTFIFVQITL